MTPKMPAITAVRTGTQTARALMACAVCAAGSGFIVLSLPLLAAGNAALARGANDLFERAERPFAEITINPASGVVPCGLHDALNAAQGLYRLHRERGRAGARGGGRSRGLLDLGAGGGDSRRIPLAACHVF